MHSARGNNLLQSNLEYITLLVGGENVIESGFVIKSEAFENELSISNVTIRNGYIVY